MYLLVYILTAGARGSTEGYLALSLLAKEIGINVGEPFPRSRELIFLGRRSRARGVAFCEETAIEARRGGQSVYWQRNHMSKHYLVGD